MGPVAHLDEKPLLECNRRGDLDCSLEASGYRALVHGHFKNPGHRIADLIRLRHAQLVVHVDPPQDQHTAILLDVTDHLRNEILGAEFYLTRSQRAGKRARESATRRRDDVVDSRGMCLDLRHVDAIMFGDRPVNTEKHGIALLG